MSLSKVINHGGREKRSLSKALLKSFSLAAASFSFAFGSEGSGNGQFMLPRGIAAGRGGNIYVADTDNNRVQVFNSSGVFQSAFGSQGR